MLRWLALGGLASLFLFASPERAEANLVLDNDLDLSGTGCGAVNCIVVVQDNGSPPPTRGLQNNDIESGCVGRSGGSDIWGASACLYDVQGGDEKPSFRQTARAGDIPGVDGFEDIAIVFNIAEVGGDKEVDLTEIYIAIYDLDGNVVFSVAFDPDDLLAPIKLAIDSGTGVGTSGFPFRMDQASAQAAAAIPFNPDFYVGGGIQLVEGTAFNGPDTVFLFGIDNPVVKDVPEPGSLLLFATALAGLGWTARGRKAKLA